MKIFVWIVGCLALAGTASAGEVWKDKQPAEWQEKEVSKFLAKSPWAKTIPMQMDPSTASGDRSNRRMGGGSSTGGMGSGAGRGGGMGGGGGRGGMGGGMDGEGGMGGSGAGTGLPGLPAVTVRWESAPLVRAANARVETKEFNAAVAEYAKDYYVISVITVAPEWQGGASGRQEDAQQAEGRSKQMQARVAEATSLKRGDNETRAPERVESLKESGGRVLFFLFPRGLNLENGGKDLSFESALGSMVIRAKFNLKEMSQGSMPGL